MVSWSEAHCVICNNYATLFTLGSNVNVVCDDWTPLHIACFGKKVGMIRLLVGSGANTNIIGEWSYTPINMLFMEYSQKTLMLHICEDEWLIKR